MHFYNSLLIIHNFLKGFVCIKASSKLKYIKTCVLNLQEITQLS